ncbi:hypothetical protein WT72_07535 [Burkholderia pseudomultivorans]|nr:hypothetical protein WT72_07535 [Burkholderia pseudomultivorans]
MARAGTASGLPFDAQDSRGRSDRGAARQCGARRSGGRRPAHRRRRRARRATTRRNGRHSCAAAPPLARDSLYHRPRAVK